MILRRYGNIDYILRMPLNDFLEFYKLAKQKEREERIFLQWVVQMPLMSQDNFVSFEDYADKITGRNIDTRSTEEMLKDIDEIERRLERGERYGA